jgi:hypothetical protein
VNGNGSYTSAPYTTTSVGQYRWVAIYPGDINNAGAQGTCGEASETSTISAPSVPAGGGGGGTPSSAAPASPTASPSASPSASSTPGARRALTLKVNEPLIPAGTTSTLVATGEPNQRYELRCYTRPSASYVTSREGLFGPGADPVVFTLALGRNTRCFIRYAVNNTQGASPSVVVNVQTVLSLSTVRTDVRTYIFQGRNLPRIAGQLITLYRVDNAGNEIRTSNLVTDNSGIYRITRTFTGNGTFRFKVRTSQTLNNAAGVSNTITVTVH